MEKYDGPAFFRGENKEKTGSMRQARKLRPQKALRPAQALPKKTVNVYQNSRGFRPTYVPPSQIKNQVRNLRKHYAHLISLLAKPKDSYWLFDEEGQDANVLDLTLPMVTFEAQVETSLQTSLATESESLSEVAALTSVSQSTEPVVKMSSQAMVYHREKTREVALDSQVTSELSRPKVESVSEVSQSMAVVSVYVESSASLASSEVASMPKIVSDENQHEAEIPVNEAEDQQEVVFKDSQEQATIDGQTMAMNTAPVASQVAVAMDEAGYQFPSLDLLPAPVRANDVALDAWIQEQVTILDQTLNDFKIDAHVVNQTIGPSVVQFELALGRGVKVNKITNLADDLQLNLAAKDVRIEAPIPGKSTVGIEVPNRYGRPVMLAEILESEAFRKADSPLTVALGVDLFGQARVTNLQKMPHGLIAGATGSGKSVFLNSILVSLLYKAKPSEVKLIIIDPKAVEMAPYQDIPHLLAPVISDMQAAAATLKWVVEEMERRYQQLASYGARNLEAFNKKMANQGDYGLKLPYIVVVIDELADLMMAASSEVQDYIARITAKARAAGIHLLVATQRPSVDVVTGTIKNNIPTRIAFMVSSQIDSRTILDQAGAERLLGRGDMLYLGNGSSQPLRLQGAYIDEEVEMITAFVRQQGQPHYAFDPEKLKKHVEEAESQDEIFPRVLDYLVNEETISTSKLQRVFGIGYNRAATIIEQLEAKQYISKSRGSKPRSVFLTQEGLNKLRQQ
ncbi:MAG: DNA translocase FtsK [Ligilactobacillus sp.]|nr:DNA translocase FtsK [Ligilactobacillus sp.]